MTRLIPQSMKNTNALLILDVHPIKLETDFFSSIVGDI